MNVIIILHCRNCLITGVKTQFIIQRKINIAVNILELVLTFYRMFLLHFTQFHHRSAVAESVPRKQRCVGGFPPVMTNAKPRAIWGATDV